jgi:hypothetical protein
VDEEEFNLNLSSNSSENAPTVPLSQAAPSSIPRQQSEIRAEPAGKRTADITPFYEINGDRKKCKFCL